MTKATENRRSLRLERLRKLVLGAEGLAVTLTIIGRPRMEPYIRGGVTHSGRVADTIEASKELKQTEAVAVLEDLAELMRGNLIRPDTLGRSKKEAA